ncbi:MAG: dethiobiotin synthase [Cyanobacteriota bacterium]
MPRSEPPRLVICGTDTDVGKTVVSALVVQGLGAHYWKPIQSGLEPDNPAGATDSERVRKLLDLPAERIVPEAYRLRAPVSPHWAAEQDGVTINPERLLALPSVAGPLVIEMAGGLLVPLRRDWLQIDLLAAWKLPVLLVARTALGTINHTLLSLEALSRRDIPVQGVLLSGEAHADNPRTIRDLTDAPLLGWLPRLDPLNAASLAHHWQSSQMARNLLA